MSDKMSKEEQPEDCNHRWQLKLQAENGAIKLMIKICSHPEISSILVKKLLEQE